MPAHCERGSVEWTQAGTIGELPTLGQNVTTTTFAGRIRPVFVRPYYTAVGFHTHTHKSTHTSVGLNLDHGAQTASWQALC